MKLRLRGLHCGPLDANPLGCISFMYLLYLDDAGSPGNQTEDYFVLGGICVYEAQVEWLSRELDKLASPFNAANPEDIEFHASAIFSRRESPWKGMSVDDARGMLKGVLKVTCSAYDTACTFACAIEKKAYPNQDPVKMAFEDLCKRFDLFLGNQGKAGNRDRGMLILDESTHETSLQKLSQEFRKVGTRWGALKNIIDTPLFVNSKASRMIQIADHVAYAVFRRYNTGDAQYFDIIAPRFHESDGIIHGLSHKHSDYATCVCPGCLSRRLGRAGEGPQSK